MKKLLFGFVVVFCVNSNLWAGSPYKYSSSAIRDSRGRTIGRQVERSSSGIKYTEQYNLSGKRIAQMRQVQSPYSSRSKSKK